MSNYNLTDNVNDSFSFSIDGIQYNVRYPLMEELEELQTLNAEIENKRKKGELNPKDEMKVQEWIYGFITSEVEGSPSITETMKKQNFKVMQNFNTMFKTEFGIE